MPCSCVTLPLLVPPVCAVFLRGPLFLCSSHAHSTCTELALTCEVPFSHCSHPTMTFRNFENFIPCGPFVMKLFTTSSVGQHQTIEWPFLTWSVTTKHRMSSAPVCSPLLFSPSFSSGIALWFAACGCPGSEEGEERPHQCTL